MPAFLRDRLLVAWALLVAVTLFSTGIGGGASSFASPGTVAVAVLTIAFVKVAMVMFTFMEVNRAPLPLRLLTIGWLIAALAVLLVIYAGVLV